MNRLVKTNDQSFTLYNDVFNEHYHSVNGALTESSHIFIKHGLHAVIRTEINLLEIGLGTGLNAVLTHLETSRKHFKVTYHGIELYPPEKSLLKSYYSCYEEPLRSAGMAISEIPWGNVHKCGDHFTLKKIQADFTKMHLKTMYNLVYFDAFSPEVHPKAWTTDVFQRISSHMSSGGILVTFSAKGMVKRSLKEAGFTINILPGPPGKRHIIQAKKN
jgi:tRNA U34 5-methylaminomethyl-2-thiouridine-forming methyltransferase MnmC